jgi:mono/diheme cytochrome c family protein
MFLTGKPEDIEVIRAKLGERSRSKAEHRNDLMLGNGRTGSWGRDSAFSDIEVLAENIRRLDPEWRNRVRPVSPDALVSASTHFTLDGSPGSGLFAKACAGCHTIGYGDGIGPDLAGVRERRDAAWLRRFLREPDLLRAEQDPIAVGLDARYPGVRMPNLGLSDLDVDDLLAYFEAEQLRVRAAKAALGGQIAPAAAPASH